MTLLERLLVGAGLWFGGLSFSVLLLGRTQSLSEGSLLAVLFFSIIVASPFIVGWFAELKKSLPRKVKISLFHYFLTAMILAFVTLQFFGAAAPEIKFDALWYHLTEAKTYLQEGQIRTFYPPAQLSQSSVTPRLQDMLYVFTLAFWPTEQLSKLLNFSFGVLSLLGVYAVGRRLAPPAGGSTVGLMAATLFSSFPIFGWLAQTAYIDLSVVFYSVLVMLVYIAGAPVGALVSFMLLGLFLSTKIWALIVLPVIFGYQIYKKQPIDSAISSIAGALFVASPWFFEALITTGNPVFPIFSVNQPELLGGYDSATEWLVKGWPRQFWPNLKRLVIHDFPLLALIPGMLLGRVRTKVVELTVVTLAIYFLFSFISNPDPRFLLPFVVIPTVLLAKLWVDQGMMVKVVAGLAMLAIVVGSFLPLYVRTERSFGVVFARESRQQYLDRQLGENVHTFIDVGNEVGSRLAPGDKAVTLVHNMFYIDFPYHDGLDLKNELQTTHSPHELLAKLKDLGYSHIVVKTAEYKLKDLFALGGFETPSQDELEKLVPIIWSSKATNTALYKIPN
ncbi:hypothetical protein HYZ64_02575 [Candidatus Berkelbacteria bacterium]|nr:hypothetical protein [Candidatus Berkelbacteria bacterium]